MSNDYTIQILPEAEEFFEYLADNLFREGYKNSYAFASKMVDEILDFVYEIPNVQHHSIPNEFLYHFERYGNNLQYARFRRKSSPKTTWYVFFEQRDNLILVKHISNNWIEGHYLRE
jgi:hypothetical protein